MAPREIQFNAFVMNCVTHQSPGLWRHPEDRSTDYTSLAHWVELARLLERGKFDAMFIADVLGAYDIYGGTPDAALRGGIQVPVNDPMMLVSAMALVTKHLGFGVTANLSYEPPYVFARRLSTLDQLTEGRIGWNIITGYLDSAARGTGETRQQAHDDRYDVAAEFLSVVYKLSTMMLVIGDTEEAAKRKLDELQVYADPEGGLVLMSGWTGVDFSKIDLDDEVRHVENDAGRTAMDNITRADPNRVWTVREVGRHIALGGIGPVIAGTPTQIADAFEAWIAETDVDGFNLTYALMPGTFADIVAHLVPELQRCGRYTRAYREGALRHKLFGRGTRLRPPHPAVATHVETTKSGEAA